MRPSIWKSALQQSMWTWSRNKKEVWLWFSKSVHLHWLCPGFKSQPDWVQSLVGTPSFAPVRWLSGRMFTLRLIVSAGTQVPQIPAYRPVKRMSPTDFQVLSPNPPSHAHPKERSTGTSLAHLRTELKKWIRISTKACLISKTENARNGKERIVCLFTELVFKLFILWLTRWKLFFSNTKGKQTPRAAHLASSSVYHVLVFMVSSSWAAARQTIARGQEDQYYSTINKNVLIKLIELFVR